MTNGGWIRSGSGSGFRKCLVEEFNSIYVFDLRGNQRTQGEQSRKEGGKVFGSGSRAPVAITLLVKNPNSHEKGVIRYHDIGDYLSRDEKLSIISRAIHGENIEWEIIKPDSHGDWIDLRNEDFTQFIPTGLQKLRYPTGIFSNYSMGISTNRDVWVYSFCEDQLLENVRKTIDYYNEERLRWNSDDQFVNIDEFVNRDTTCISWTRGLKGRLKSNTEIEYHPELLTISLYRPFCKQFLYYDSKLIEMPLRQMELFPNDDSKLKNLEIIVSGVSHNKAFSCLMTENVPCLDAIEKSQCFPLYWYEKKTDGKYIRHDAITDETLDFFKTIYPRGFTGRLVKYGGPQITKEDIFYYIYGILHSPEYRQRFETNLKRELPRIPMSENFTKFSAAGRELARIHLGYEDAELYPVKMIGNAEMPGYVTKMKWGKKRNPITKKMEIDKSVLIYNNNNNLTFKEIPEAAHRYVVNGRTPLEWMVDRYQIKTDKASGIVNDPNKYSEDPLYIPSLIRRLITVSVETVKIIENMPSVSEINCVDTMPEIWRPKDI